MAKVLVLYYSAYGHLETMANAVAEGKIDIMPEILVTGGGSSLDGLAATLMRTLNNGGGTGKPLDGAEADADTAVAVIDR